MSSLKDFTLLAKLEAMALDSHKIVKKFEKSERHVLSADIRHTNATLVRLVIRAVKKQLEERRLRLPMKGTKALLVDVDVELEYLKTLVRMAFSLRQINEQTYETWSRQIKEIGGMLGGWMKTVNADIEKKQGAAPGQTPRQTPAPEGRQGSLLG